MKKGGDIMEQAISNAVGFLKYVFEEPITAIPKILVAIHKEQKRHNKEVEELLKKIAEK